MLLLMFIYLTKVDILEGKKEQDTVIFKDPHPTNGFILLPDFKWNSVDIPSLYCLGIHSIVLPS